MKKGTTGQATEHMNAPPEKVYDLVSDVTRIPEWSPECVRCHWIGGATGPAVGAHFKGTNRRGLMRWSTKPRVVAADPGREFAFVANAIPVGDTTKWTYRFEPSPSGGTDVTESFEIVHDVPRYIVFGERLMGIKDRRADLQKNMQETLGRLKAAVEGSA